MNKREYTVIMRPTGNYLQLSEMERGFLSSKVKKTLEKCEVLKVDARSFGNMEWGFCIHCQ
jgi:hypothetical protein